jgi:predicted TIM-barrel fold metal-dependent hydrolase
MKHSLIPTVALLVVCAWTTPTIARDYRYTDAHLHYVDFFQKTEGMDDLFEAMDAAGVDHAVIAGMPLTKKWHEDEPQRPRYYQGDDAPVYWYSATDPILVEAIRDLPSARRERLHPFLSGFNPNDKNATAHIEQMLRLYPDVWEGIGEVITRHDDLTAMIQGDTPRANGEAMMRVYKLAAEHDLPVLLHSNLTSVREREPIYLEELEEALSKNRDTRIIWAHAGTSGEINRWQEEMPYLLPTIETLLARHDNLWIDLSWSVMEPHILDDEGQPRSAWLTLIRAHPDRFMIGSDLVGRFGNLGESMHRFDPLLDALDAPVARKLARDNLLAILPRKPARLPSDD